jgi:glycosyltransferase involved in cell wall biosynthesis
MPDKIPPVLVLGDHFGYPGGVAHGVTTYFVNVLPALVDSGVDLTACFLREPHPAAQALQKRGIEPIFLSANRWNPHVVSRVTAIARSHGCRIVHAAGIKGSLVGRIVARLTRAEVLVHVHDMLYPTPLVRGLNYLFSRPADLGLCVSRAVQDVVVDGYYVHRDRARVIHNGISIEHIRNVAPDARLRVRQVLGISPEIPVIAMVARMHPVKGHRAMIHIMSLIAKARPDAMLLLAGDGPERAACEAMTAERGLQANVHFLGQRNDVPELLAASDVVVMPSQSEGLPLAAIEALAAGRPVVGFDVGGMRDVVTDGSDGRVVKAADADAFAAAVIELLRDRAALTILGQRASVAAERFSLDNHVQRLLECYREAAAPAWHNLELRQSMRG